MPSASVWIFTPPENKKARLGVTRRALTLIVLAWIPRQMQHDIVCTPPQEMGGYDSFLYQEFNPQPCCLTVEEFRLPDWSERPHRRRRRPAQVQTDEPRRWVDVL